MSWTRLARFVGWPIVFTAVACLLIVSGNTANAWPVAVLLITCLIVVSGVASEFMAAIAGRVSRLAGFGFQMELVPLTAHNVDTIRDSIEETFRSYRSKIKRDFDHLIHIHKVDAQREQVLQKYALPLLPEEVRRDFRATVFVEDVLFEDVIYQLLDYYPKGRGRGRTFSMRFGILGRTWRMGEHQTEGQIPFNSDELVRCWGMTPHEAARTGQGRHSFACVILRDGGDSPVGIFYLDAPMEHAFGRTEEEQDRLRRALLQGSQDCGLIASLAEIHREMRKRGPAIRIFNPKWE